MNFQNETPIDICKRCGHNAFEWHDKKWRVCRKCAAVTNFTPCDKSDMICVWIRQDSVNRLNELAKQLAIENRSTDEIINAIADYAIQRWLDDLDILQTELALDPLTYLSIKESRNA